MRVPAPLSRPALSSSRSRPGAGGPTFRPRIDRRVGRLLAALAAIIMFTLPAGAQETDDVETGPGRPLGALGYFIGTWGFTEQPEEDGFQLTFRWGRAEKAIVVEAPIMEGLIVWHPSQEKIIFVAHQTRSNLLFEGEYEILRDGRIQRVYTVYAADERNDGNTFRETWTRIDERSFHWKTERLVDGSWEPFGPNDGEATAHRWR